MTSETEPKTNDDILRITWDGLSEEIKWKIEFMERYRRGVKFDREGLPFVSGKRKTPKMGLEDY